MKSLALVEETVAAVAGADATPHPVAVTLELALESKESVVSAPEIAITTPEAAVGVVDKVTVVVTDDKVAEATPRHVVIVPSLIAVQKFTIDREAASQTIPLVEGGVEVETSTSVEDLKVVTPNIITSFALFVLKLVMVKLVPEDHVPDCAEFAFPSLAGAAEGVTL